MLPISERTQYPARPARAICPIGQNLPDDPRASNPALEDHAVHLHLSKLLLLDIHNIYCQYYFRCIKGCCNVMFFSEAQSFKVDDMSTSKNSFFRNYAIKTVLPQYKCERRHVGMVAASELLLSWKNHRFYQSKPFLGRGEVRFEKKVFCVFWWC